MTVMISLAIVGIIAGSIASLISFQRKMGIRQQLKLHSMAAAEAAIDYVYSYVTNDANLNGIDQSNYIPPYGADPKAFVFSADALKFLKNKNNSAFGADPINFTDIKVTVLPRPDKQTRVYIDPKEATNPNRGQWVYQEKLTLVSSVTSVQGGIKQTSYASKDINYNITNLFQHAIFYQGQLHLHRGFKVMGSVHTNGNLIMNAHGGDRAVYSGFVAAGNRFYRGSCMTGDQSGNFGTNAFGLVPELPASDPNHGDLDPVQFKTVATGGGDGTQDTTSTFAASSFNGDLPIFIDTLSPSNFRYRFVNTTTDSRMSNWTTMMSSSTTGFNNCLQDRFASVPVPIINPIGSSGYNMNTDGTATNSPYFLIEPLLPKTHPLRTSATSQKTNYRYNLSANASLVLRVEYAARNASGYLVPDPNADYTYQAVQGGPLLPQSMNPANYIVRAYAKPAGLARVNDPTERLPIPFPTDVIGRADYNRRENSLANGFVTGSVQSDYNWAAARAPHLIDVLGTENGITAALSPRLNTATANLGGQSRVDAEAWHRYRIEPYQATTSAPSYTTGGSGGTPILDDGSGSIGIPGFSAFDSQPTGLTASTPDSNGTKQTPNTNYNRYVPNNAFPATNTSTAGFAKYGLHDSRLGRGVHLLTIDIGRLKEIMEAPLATVAAQFGAEALAFRLAFNNGNSQWNGIVYVEFPTSTRVLTAVNRAPPASVYRDNATQPGTPGPGPVATDFGKSYLDSYLFDYAPVGTYPNTAQGAETRYPLRTSDSTVIGRADQTVPIAQAFRLYPATVNARTITDPANAILALQVVNANQLPKVNITKFDGTKGNVLPSGFTLATNAPLYLIGSWNSDGNYLTGTNVTSTDPTAFATTDTGTATDLTNPEIPSAIFCDMFTVLSPGWATQINYPSGTVNGLTRRQNSFPGWGGDSDKFRRVTFKQNAAGQTYERIEVSASIATGDFPIFEFFPHALEDFNLTNGTPCTPLVVKGAMVSMFSSEVQHIKQAYGRDPTKDIQTYWSGHGANNFPSPRFHQFLVNGDFPPGTPQALLPTQSNFQAIFKNDPLVIQAGF